MSRLEKRTEYEILWGLSLRQLLPKDHEPDSEEIREAKWDFVVMVWAQDRRGKESHES